MSSDQLHADALALADTASELWRSGHVREAMARSSEAAQRELAAVISAVEEHRDAWAAILAVSAAALFLEGGQMVLPSPWQAACERLPFTPDQRDELTALRDVAAAIQRVLSRWRSARGHRTSPDDESQIERDLALLTPRERLLAMALGAFPSPRGGSLAERATMRRDRWRNACVVPPHRERRGVTRDVSIRKLPRRTPNPIRVPR